MNVSAPIFASLSKAEYATPCGAAVQLAVRVAALLPSEYHEGRSRRRLRLMDLDGPTFMETTPVLEDLVMQRATAALRSGGVLVARGRFVPHGGGKKTPPGVRFDLEALQAAPPPSTLLGADPELIARTDQLLDKLIKEGTFFDYLCARSYEHLSIDPTFSERFQKTIHLIALQALSQGQLPSSTNGRLSVFVVSMPSQGKKRSCSPATGAGGEKQP